MDQLISNSDNRVELKGFDFRGDFKAAMIKLDRFFYLNYTRSLLSDVERVRGDASIKKKGLFDRLAKRASGGQFVLEYEGVTGGINRLGGHRHRLTEKINRVYYLITKEKPAKIAILDRHHINTTILSTPLGGLEVASQILNMVKSYQQLAKHQSEQIKQVFDNEIWKWLFYWVFSAHGMGEKEQFDIFKIYSSSSPFIGAPTKKISDLISFSRDIKNPSLQYLFRYLLLVFVTQAQDYLLQREEEITEPEGTYEQKILIDMLLKHFLFIMDSKETRAQNKGLQLKPVEQELLFALYPFHPMRVKKTLSYYLVKRSARHLAWQVKCLPDENFFFLANSMNEDGKKRLLKELKAISRINKKPTEKEKELINKLETKTKKVLARSTSGASPAFSAIQTIRVPKETPVDSETGPPEKIEPTEENLKILAELIVRPFFSDVQVEEKKLSVCATNLAQILMIKNKRVYSETLLFLAATNQLAIAKGFKPFIWDYKEKVIEGGLTPIESITISDLSTSLSEAQVNCWKDIIPSFYIKVGKTSADLKNYEQNIVALFDRLVTFTGENSEQTLEIEQLLNLSRENFNLWLESFKESKAASPEEVKTVFDCWSAYHHEASAPSSQPVQN